MSQQFLSNQISQTQDLDDSQIISITQDLNNSKKDLSTIPELIKTEPKDNLLINYLTKFIIILVVYLIFSTDFIKKIFSNIIVNLYPSDNNISLVSLIIYGCIISAVCILVEYKLNDWNYL